MCIHSWRCLHYTEAQKKTKVKGKWIDTELCRHSDWDGDIMIKPPFDKLLLKENDERD